MIKKVRNILPIMILALAGAVTSCTSEYPGLVYIPDNEISQNKEELTSINITPTLNYKTLFYASAETRGGGAFDSNIDLADFEDHYMNSRFYVLAYRYGKGQDGLAGDADFSLLMNSNGNPDRKDCLMSTDVVFPADDQHRGKAMMPVDMTGELKFVDDTDISEEGMQPKYYKWTTNFPTTGYNFFAYYIDDADYAYKEVSPERVSMDLTFNGSQDILYGAAPVLTKQLIEDNYPGVVTGETKENIVNYGQGAYTTYGALHSVQPKIDFKHALVRLNVNCTQMTDTADVEITKIVVKSRTHGTLVVADRDRDKIGFTPSGDYTKLTFPNVNRKLMEGQKVQLGRGILVTEEDSYDVELYFNETTKKSDASTDTETKSYKQEFTLKLDDDTFHAGTQYNLDITVFGALRININVVNDQNWKIGGEVSQDMEDW